MRCKSIVDVIRMRMVKQRLDPKILDEGKEIYASGSMVKKTLNLKRELTQKHQEKF